MAAVGYMGDPSELRGDLKERKVSECTRKPIDDIAFYGEWEGE